MAGLEEWIRPLTIQAVGHFGAGVALSLLDRMLSRPRPDSRKQVLARQREGLMMLDYLSGLAQPPATSESRALPAQEEVDEAAAFLRQLAHQGELEWLDTAYERNLDDDNLLQELATDAKSGWAGLKSWLGHEKLNPLSLGGKLRAAYLLEILADVAVAISAIAWGRGNFIGAIGHSLYQGFAMFLGLATGSIFFKRRDHRAPRRLRKEVKQLQEQLAQNPQALALAQRMVDGERIWVQALTEPPAALAAEAWHEAEDERTSEDDRP